MLCQNQRRCKVQKWERSKSLSLIWIYGVGGLLMIVLLLIGRGVEFIIAPAFFGLALIEFLSMRSRQTTPRRIKREVEKNDQA